MKYFSVFQKNPKSRLLIQNNFLNPSNEAPRSPSPPSS